MSCPRCGFSEPGPVECPRCGVVFARLNRRPPPASAPEADRSARPPGRSLSWVDGLLILVGIAALATILWPRRRDPATPTAPPTMASRPGPDERARPSAPPSPAPRPARQDPTPPAEERPLPDWAIVPSPSPVPPSGALRLAVSPPRTDDDEDVAALLERVERREPLDSSHVEAAEALFDARPRHLLTRRVLRELLWEAARQAGERGRSATEQRFLERATELMPEDRVVWLKLIGSHEASRRWSDAERAAERALAALPDDSGLHVALARALSQQGRDEEAADLLRRRLRRRPADTAARAQLARLEEVLDSEEGLDRRRSRHFSVRFDGEADEDLGRALLAVLEEKHDMLARTLGFRPERPIPVILLPRQTFRSVSRAPKWAAGYFSHSDARIRIGTRDLSPGFVPLDLERLLTHELVHAFIHARAGGRIPGDVNEGLAQYLSGKRLGYKLDPARAEVRDGRMNVDDFYDSALSFVEYLIGRYRQQALNDLLKYAAETGSVDQAFRRAFSRTYEEAREEWLRSLR